MLFTKDEVHDWVISAKDFIADNLLTHTTYFAVIYTIAIFLNGCTDYKFDTEAIVIGYGVIAGRRMLNHTIDSTLNSNKGQMPDSNAVVNKYEEK